MKILIAGGAGYIGSRLAPYLYERGYDITVLDLMWFGNTLPKDIPIIKKDIFNIDESFLKRFDQVIFLAGLSNDPMAEYSPALNFIANASAPTYLAYVAKRAGVKRFIYADSCSVYGYTGGKILTEKSPAKSIYPYGISKLQGEIGIENLEDNSFSVIQLRKGTLSGYSPRMRFDLLVNTMYMKAMTEKTIIVNNPRIWRPLLSMEDALKAYEKSVKAPLNIGGIFNISSCNITVGDAGKAVQKHFKIVHNIPIVLEVKNKEDYRNYKASNKKARDILDIEFTGTVSSILKELDAHFDYDFNYGDDKHYNIKVFKKIFNNISKVF